jgi:hypothetical protein
MAAINSAGEAALWAQRHMPAKNTLTAADAKMVEERFKARLATMSDSPHHDGPSEGPPLSGTPDGLLAPTGRPHALAEQGAVTVGGPDVNYRHKAKTQPRKDVVNALGKTVRLRDKDHRKFVLRQACLVCDRVPSIRIHLTFTQPRFHLGFDDASSSCRSAESTIASCISRVTRPRVVA